MNLSEQAGIDAKASSTRLLVLLSILFIGGLIISVYLVFLTSCSPNMILCVHECIFLTSPLYTHVRFSIATLGFLWFLLTPIAIGNSKLRKPWIVLGVLGVSTLIILEFILKYFCILCLIGQILGILLMMIVNLLPQHYENKRLNSLTNKHIMFITVVLALSVGMFFKCQILDFTNEMMVDNEMPQSGIYVLNIDKLEKTTLNVEPIDRLAVVTILSRSCKACIRFWPVLTSISNKYTHKYNITFYVVILGSTSENLDVKRLTTYYTNKHYWNRGVPAVIIFNNGEYLGTWLGFMSSEIFRDKLDSIIESVSGQN